MGRATKCIKIPLKVEPPSKPTEVKKVRTGRFVKGSPEAKAFMAKLRAKMVANVTKKLEKIKVKDPASAVVVSTKTIKNK